MLNCYFKRRLEMNKRDPYKVNILMKILEEMNKDEYFSAQVKAYGKEFIALINLDEGAIRELIKYYGG